MAQNSSEPDAPEQEASPEEEAPRQEPSEEQRYAARVAETVGAVGWSADFGNVKVRLEPDRWVEAVRQARDELELVFFSWLSAIDWSHRVEVGEPPEEEVEERLELLCRVSDLTEGRGVTFSCDLPQEGPVIDSLVEVFPGADWHERECHEMFGIDFRGHPNLIKLYLPDAFEGHPLRKTYPLLTREVKPWPGKVDVEDMPAEAEERQMARFQPEAEE